MMVDKYKEFKVLRLSWPQFIKYKLSRLIFVILMMNYLIQRVLCKMLRIYVHESNKQSHIPNLLYSWKNIYR